jgi:hypothetical membrane protein
VRSGAGGVAWWAVVSSVVAPVAMIGGWTLAAALQPPGYSALRQTISALAAHGAHDRWVMTLALAVVGVCHLVTASGLRPARTPGRILLAVGGAATIAVAAFPEPQHGSALGHTLAAGAGFIALTCWPLAAHTSGGSTLVLRLPTAATATVVSAVLLIVFFVSLRGGNQVGLTERLLAGAQSLWPAIVTVRAASRSQTE